MGSSLSSGSPPHQNSGLFGAPAVGALDELVVGSMIDNMPSYPSHSLLKFYAVVYLPLFLIVMLCWESHVVAHFLVLKSANFYSSLDDSSFLGIWRPNVVALLLAWAVAQLAARLNKKPWPPNPRRMKQVNGLLVDMPPEPTNKRLEFQKLRQTIGYYLVGAFSDPWNAFLLSTLLRYDLDRRFYAENLESAIEPYSTTAAITRQATLVRVRRDNNDFEPHQKYWCGFEIRYKINGTTFVKNFLGFRPLESTFEGADGRDLLYTLQDEGLPMDIKILAQHPESALPVYLLDQAFFELAATSRQPAINAWHAAWRAIEVPLYYGICLYSGFYMYTKEAAEQLKSLQAHGSWKPYVDIGIFCLGALICHVPISYSNDCKTIVQQGQGSLYGFLDMTCRQEEQKTPA